MFGEVIGYLAALLLVAYVAVPAARHRAVVLVGLVGFLVYGVLIASGPIVLGAAFTGLWIATLAVRERRSRRDGTVFGALPMEDDAPFLTDFVDRHLDQITLHQPGFRAVLPGDLAFLLTRDGLPAGALVGRQEGRTLYLHLDYVIPAYRDNGMGGWLYGPGNRVFRERGITEVVTYPETEYHAQYLRTVGFTHDAGGALRRPL